MSKLNKNKPWLNYKGEPLSFARLQKKTPFWGDATWQAYADSLAQSVDQATREQVSDNFDSLLSAYDREESVRRFLEAERGENQDDERPLTYDPNALARALNDLPYLEREVLFLAFWEGRTEREIAEHLEHSRGKIQIIIKRAMEAMRKKIQISQPEKSPQATEPKEKN